MGWWSNLLKRGKRKDKNAIIEPHDEKIAKSDLKHLQERIVSLLEDLQGLKKYCNVAYTQCTVALESGKASGDVRESFKVISSSQRPLLTSQKLPERPPTKVLIEYNKQRVRDLLVEKTYWMSQKSKYKNIKEALGILGNEEPDPPSATTDAIPPPTILVSPAPTPPATPQPPKTIDDLLLDL
eukprot:TRINITY_DN38788_c0_g1_i1.p1 TRINITY_DN38788_c0_g1~~TRINITY_DN38788_c0_g1_i1.p1  ORF type:complete len:193 (+),score=42.22 TRINITY_DN38788_c0_g1_i1:31-579(+)